MNDNGQFRLELYRQFWEQARHNESLRANFTVFFALIANGTIALLARANVDATAPFWVLVGLSFFGYLVSWRTRNNARRYTRNQVRIELREGLNQYLPRNFWKDGRRWISSRRRTLRGRAWLKILCCRAPVVGRPLRWIRLDNLYLSMYTLAGLIFILIAVGVIPFLDP